MVHNLRIMEGYTIKTPYCVFLCQGSVCLAKPPPLPIPAQPAVTISKPDSFPSLSPTPIFLQATQDSDFYFILLTTDSTSYSFRKYQKLLRKSQPPFSLWLPSPRNCYSFLLFLLMRIYIFTNIFILVSSNTTVVCYTYSPACVFHWMICLRDVYISTWTAASFFNDYITFHCMEVPPVTNGPSLAFDHLLSRTKVQ